MLQFCVFSLLTVGLSATPLPYYSSSIVETPTSRVVQHLMLSPQLHQSYRIHPHQVHPYSPFNIPQHQQFAQHEREPEVQLHAQAQQVQHGQHDESFQRRLQQQQQHGSLVQQHHDSLHHQHHGSPQQHQVAYYYYNPQPNDPNQPVNLYNLRQDMPWWQQYWNQFAGQNFEGEDEAETEEEESEGSLEELFGADKNKPDLEAETTTAQPRLGEPESNEIAPKGEIATTTQAPVSSEPITASQSLTETNQPEYSGPSQLLHRYYLINGPPEFYGNADQPSMIFSLQHLQPVVRASDNDGSAAQKIAPLTATTTTTNAPEPSTSLRIHVVDSEEVDGVEEEKLNASTTSELPSDDRTTKAPEEGRDKEKNSSRDQLEVEGECN